MNAGAVLSEFISAFFCFRTLLFWAIGHSSRGCEERWACPRKDWVCLFVEGTLVGVVLKGDQRKTEPVQVGLIVGGFGGQAKGQQPCWGVQILRKDLEGLEGLEAIDCSISRVFVVRHPRALGLFKTQSRSFYRFFLWEGLPTKINCRKQGTFVLTSILEDLVTKSGLLEWPFTSPKIPDSQWDDSFFLPNDRQGRKKESADWASRYIAGSAQTVQGSKGPWGPGRGLLGASLAIDTAQGI